MKPSLGIEIGEKYLKLVAVRPAMTKGGGVSVDFEVEPIAGFADDQIIRAVLSYLTRNKFKPKITTICIPRNMLTVKTLQLPTRDPKESEQMIDLHLGRLVPFKKEEIVFGHKFLGTNTMGYSTEMLAIIRRDSLRRQCNIIEGAGLSPDRMALSSHAAWQWVLSSFKIDINDKDLYMLLDIDNSFIDLVIFGRTQLLFSRTISIESDQGSLNTFDMAKLVNEIKQSLIIFYNEAMHKKPMAIFLSGSYVASGLREKLEAEFGLTVKEVMPPYSKYPPKTGMQGPLKSVSLSAVSELVLEDSPDRINFILPEVQIKRSLKEKTTELVILGTLLIYFFSVMFAFFVERFAVKQSYLNRIDKQNTVIEESVGVMISEAKQIEFIKDFLYDRKQTLAMLQELQKIVTPKISLEYISIDNAYTITLRGQGDQLADVFDFTTKLEKSDYFANVATKRTRTKQVKEREVTDFEITMNASIK